MSSQQTNKEVLHKVLRRGHQPLIFNTNLDAKGRNYNLLCADGNFRHCNPVLAAWLADCPEYSHLHHLERHVCFSWECPKNELGDYVPPDKQHPRQDHNLYQRLRNANTKAANAQILSRHVHQGFNVFRHIPSIVSNLPKPKLIHTMQISMLGHLEKWIFHFMKTHEPLDKFNAIWLSAPAYHDFTPKNKSYESVSR